MAHGQVTIEIASDAIALPTSMAIRNFKVVDGVGQLDFINRDNTNSVAFMFRLYSSAPPALPHQSTPPGVPAPFRQMGCFRSADGLQALQFEGQPNPEKAVVVIQSEDFQLNIYGNDPELFREVFASIAVADWLPCPSGPQPTPER